MIDMHTKKKKEELILSLFEEIVLVEDKSSFEYKKLLQKIYTPIWEWTLICFDKENVQNSGVEIFHCIKRTLLKYENNSNTSYIGYLYSCIENEIRHNKKNGEFNQFRMCTNDEYNRAVRLIDAAKKIGKNPGNESVQIWLSKQSGLTLNEVKDLVFKYYQSQIVANQIKNNESEEEISIFETDSVHNNYLTPEESLFKTEYLLEDLKKIEQAFEKCQERQKLYLSSFITLKVLQVLERNFLISQIVDLLKERSFTDLELLKTFSSQSKMPTQRELAAKFGKDEGYISNRISEFFKKIE
ncbi:hypothetical protein [uncultured Treponema sp.]|uniref:hypothetical protein n=1 Tax=uncultured Treponema sp. TaxID=162155 RepID=UPI0025F5F327|nr:hypothetical protein [uncultured Treponema sp.]